MAAAIEKLTDHLRPDTCLACRRPVIWASMGGKQVPIETCADGVGDVGLTWPLFATPTSWPTAEVLTTRTRYRLHRGHCSDRQGRATGGAGPFSGESFKRKRKGTT